MSCNTSIGIQSHRKLHIILHNLPCRKRKSQHLTECTHLRGYVSRSIITLDTFATQPWSQDAITDVDISDTATATASPFVVIKTTAEPTSMPSSYRSKPASYFVARISTACVPYDQLLYYIITLSTREIGTQSIARAGQHRRRMVYGMRMRKRVRSVH